jgi:uncharacterized protein
MDGIVLGLFLLAAFAGGFASGLAGFAMGFVVSGIWLHILTPVQTTALIVGYGLLTQGYGVWKLRQALCWESITPFIVGGIIGVQRAVFQPVMLAAIIANVVSLGIAGAVTADILRLYLLGLPAMLAGLWVGFKLYGKLDDAAFRKIVLVLLLIAGLGLILPRGL